MTSKYSEFRFTIRNVLYVIASAMSFLYTLSVFVPLVQTGDGLRLEWLLALSVAREKGLTFGREIAFTYGPLGFSWAGYYPSTFWMLVLTWTVIGTLVWFALWLATRQMGGSRWWRLIGITAFAMAAAGEHTSVHDSRLLLLPILLLGYHFLVDDRPLSWPKELLLFAMAIAGLIKFTYLVAGTGAVVAVSLDELLHPNHRSPSLTVFATLYFIGWCLLGQLPSDLPNYLASSLDVTTGFPEAMALWTRTEGMDILRFIVPAVLLVALVAWRQPAAGRLRASFHAAALAGLLLLVFRAGYVRHDQHEIISTSTLLPAVVFYAIASWSHKMTLRVRVAWLMCFGLALSAASHSYSTWWGPNILDRSVESISNATQEVAEIGHLASGHGLSIAALYERRMRETAAQFPLPRVKGTVDLWPWQLNLLFANHLDYAPRPALESLACYTPRLAEADAVHLRGPHAPANIFFRISPIDGRLPSIEDSRSWLEILSRYQVIGQASGFLQLQQAVSPRPYTMHKLSTVTASFDKEIILPRLSPGLIWVTVDIHQTVTGKLVNNLYKLPPMFIRIRLVNGQTCVFRFIDEVGRGGFLLSPLVLNNAGFSALDNTALPEKALPPMPGSFTLVGNHDSDLLWCYEPEFSVSFFIVEFDGGTSVHAGAGD